MINQSFDNEYNAVINPPIREDVTKCDVIIVTFSNEIEEFVVEKFNATKVNEFSCVNGKTPIYTFNYNNKVFGFYKTILGSAGTVGMMEDVLTMFDCKKVLVFGSAGTLDKDCHGKVMVPTFAYRDEGTSYHYAKAEDYIKIKNSDFVSGFMKKHNIPHKEGKTWTTDAFYRETKKHLENRQSEGCIAVEMECSAVQAMCDFRSVDLYYFLISGDLLDAPEWDKAALRNANHNFNNFDIALHLACEI